MRLVIIAPHLPEYAVRYAEAMARRCDTLVCVDAAQLASEYEGREVPAIPNGRIEPVLFKTPTDLWRLFRLVIRFRPTVIHVQEAAGPRRGIFLACIATVMKLFALVVLTVHDPVPHEGRDLTAARRTAWPRDYVRRLADIIVVHGAYCAQQLCNTALAGRRQIVESEHGLILEPPPYGRFRPDP